MSKYDVAIETSLNADELYEAIVEAIECRRSDDLFVKVERVEEENLWGIFVKTINQTCSACPSQWEGTTTDGRSVYVRYRHGGLTVHLDGEAVFYKHVPRMADGYMTWDEVEEHTGLRRS